MQRGHVEYVESSFPISVLYCAVRLTLLRSASCCVVSRHETTLVLTPFNAGLLCNFDFHQRVSSLLFYSSPFLPSYCTPSLSLLLLVTLSIGRCKVEVRPSFFDFEGLSLLFITSVVSHSLKV